MCPACGGGPVPVTKSACLLLQVSYKYRSVWQGAKAGCRQLSWRVWLPARCLALDRQPRGGAGPWLEGCHGWVPAAELACLTEMEARWVPHLDRRPGAGAEPLGIVGMNRLRGGARCGNRRG